MKKIIVTGAVAAIAAVSFAGNASAAPDPKGRLLRSGAQVRHQQRGVRSEFEERR
jgi:hypothetical protein